MVGYIIDAFQNINTWLGSILLFAYKTDTSIIYDKENCLIQYILRNSNENAQILWPCTSTQITKDAANEIRIKISFLYVSFITRMADSLNTKEAYKHYLSHHDCNILKHRLIIVRKHIHKTTGRYFIQIRVILRSSFNVSLLMCHI